MKFTVKAFRSVVVLKVLGFRGCSLNVWFRVWGGGVRGGGGGGRNCQGLWVCVCGVEGL